MICIRTDYIYIEYYKKTEIAVIKYEFFDLSRWAKKSIKDKEDSIKF